MYSSNDPVPVITAEEPGVQVNNSTAGGTKT